MTGWSSVGSEIGEKFAKHGSGRVASERRFVVLLVRRQRHDVDRIRNEIGRTRRISAVARQLEINPSQFSRVSSGKENFFYLIKSNFFKLIYPIGTILCSLLGSQCTQFPYFKICFLSKKKKYFRLQKKLKNIWWFFFFDMIHYSS